MNQKKKTVKLAAVSPKIRLGDVDFNLKASITEAKRAAEAGARVLVFPRLTLTGATCRDMFCHPILPERAERALMEYISATSEYDMISFIGLPVLLGGVYSCTAAVYAGRLLALIPNELQSEEEARFFSEPPKKAQKVEFAGFEVAFPSKNVIRAPFDKKLKISVGASGADARIVVDSLAAEATVGSFDKRRAALASLSYLANSAFVYAYAGIGESTTDAVYSAHNMIADRAELLAVAEPFAEDSLILADIELESSGEKEAPTVDFSDLFGDGELTKCPFLPDDPIAAYKACLEALEIQAQGLAARVSRSYSRAMVIGVSGGLDSTLALLVAARAADILSLDRKCVIGVTMPCFGTTIRTKSNAQSLSELLGISFRTVDIKNSVAQHLSDIGHDGVTPDVTYENAQARERTQVLMDIANMTGGLVVGTGDLSELVLGWATYNGDHMSMYAVNASVPKTMVRRIVEVYSESERAANPAISAVLDDILATPVSPELLPPKDGEIAQCTESLVGPYELHDFFIYTTLYLGCSVRQTAEAAKEIFAGDYDNKTILGWLRVFIRRFFSQQFKRSCMPDGPQVCPISLSPRGGLFMPSDMSAAVWLEELEEIEKEEK